MKMSVSVTACAAGNQILLGIIPQPAARAEMVDLKILLVPQSWQRTHRVRALHVRVDYPPQDEALVAAASVWAGSRQFPTIFSNCSLSPTGSALMSRASARNNVFSAPAFWLAPARKSAQIISRQ